MKSNYSFLLSFCIISTSSLSQNVGIGTITPAARLHVVGSSPDLAVFSGGNSMYITLAEGVNNRGYIGSFLGNAEDVDFGGSSVSVAFKGIFGNGSFEADFIVGTPSSLGMKGNIAQYRTIENITMLTNGLPDYNDHTTLYKLKNHSDNMDNAETGYSCDMFDTNKLIIRIPGKSNNKGGVIFSF